MDGAERAAQALGGASAVPPQAAEVARPIVTRLSAIQGAWQRVRAFTVP